MPTGQLQPAFEQEELREPSIHDAPTRPVEFMVHQQTSWKERVACQQLRNGDLLDKGHSHIADQGIAFLAHIPIDLDRVLALPQPLVREGPDPDDEEDEEEVEIDRQSRRSVINRQPLSPPPAPRRHPGGEILPPRPSPRQLPDIGQGGGRAPQ